MYELKTGIVMWHMVRNVVDSRLLQHEDRRPKIAMTSVDHALHAMHQQRKETASLRS